MNCQQRCREPISVQSAKSATRRKKEKQRSPFYDSAPSAQVINKALVIKDKGRNKNNTYYFSLNFLEAAYHEYLMSFRPVTFPIMSFLQRQKITIPRPCRQSLLTKTAWPPNVVQIIQVKRHKKQFISQQACTCNSLF